MAHEDFALIWQDAMRHYADTTGKDIKDLPMPETTEDLIKDVEEQNGQFKNFREKQRTIFTVLSAAVKPIETVGNMAAGAASAVFQPTQQVFGAAMYLIQAARGVSASLEAIVDLLSMLKDFTVRLKVYNSEDLSQVLREKLTEILVTVIEIFARSTKVISEGVLGRLKAYGKNVLLGDDKKMQILVAKLDKLTQSEDRLVGVETLVETKRTGRAVEGVQVSVGENTTRLSELAVSTHQVSSGVGQILSTLEESKAEARAEKDVVNLEIVKKFLSPSVLAQDRFDEIKREHVPESGDWIHAEETLQAWIAGKSPILWISGNPGSGKSFLTFNIISYLHELHQDATGHAGHASVAYFFFRDNKDQTRSFEQALRDIAYQLAQTDQLYAKHVANVSKRNPDVESIRSAWQKLFVDFFIVGDSVESSAFILLDGIDESFETGRTTFFELLNDVQSSGVKSRVRVGMLGRPQIIDEIADQLGSQISTIHVDWTKNGGDIAHYVELSIGKSRVLNRVSRSLKALIIQTLSSKANGMFMWVKLMIAELSKKSREGAIKDALNKAPRGLTEMLTHVLEGFSATLTEEDADDLNDMLAWVTLAKRPLALGELDAMLRLKSAEGDGVIYLEGKLRKQFASFFTLTREDNLTTADLHDTNTHIYDDDDTQAGAEPDEGLDDVENETDFNSNPKTTMLSFSHASISDFFRNGNHSRIIAPGADHPAVGVDLAEAKINMAQTCIKLHVDESLHARMADAVSLIDYAKSYWTDHLVELDTIAIRAEERIAIGKVLAVMMYEEKPLASWCGPKGYSFFTAENAKIFLGWLSDKGVLEQLQEDTVDWIKAAEKNAVELFEPVARHRCKDWLLPDRNKDIKVCVLTVFSYITRKAGGVVEKEPKPSAEQIADTARWGGFETTAEWHRRLALALRQFDAFDVALEHFGKALELDSSQWRVKLGISNVYMLQKRWTDALVLSQAAVELGSSTDDMEALHDAYRMMACCYVNLADESKGDGDMREEIILLKAANENCRKAFSFVDTDYVCPAFSLTTLYRMANRSNQGHMMTNDDAVPDTKADLPTKAECYSQVTQMLYQMDETSRNGTTNLIKYFEEFKLDLDGSLLIMALATIEEGKLPWLQGKFQEAIAYEDKNLQTVNSACMSLNLARLYGVFGDDGDRAMKIWHAIGTRKATSAAVASEIGLARTYAINHLGQYCIRKAIEDESGAAWYIEKMERIAAKRRYGARMGTEDSVPPNDIALFLAAWYRKLGRHEQAREIIKPHIRDALMILSDDNPTNDCNGYYNLSRAMIAIGDDTNAIASLHTIRPYKNGRALLKRPGLGTGEATADEAGESVNGPRENSWNKIAGEFDKKRENRDEPQIGGGWSCDGVCVSSDGSSYTDGKVTCRYCNLDFCVDCYDLVLTDKLPLKMCGKTHSFLTIPYLTPQQVFKFGEVLVDGKAIPVDKWKADLRRQYGL